MKVVVNKSYGGFRLSEAAIERLKELGGKGIRVPPRCDPLLVQVVEELGKEVNGAYGNLVIEEFDDKYMGCYEIREYDGLEHIEVDWCAVCHTIREKLTPDNATEWLAKLANLLNHAI